MADGKTGEFERSIARIEEIVKQLEAGEIGLDQSVKLYREGRDLAKKCEELLRAAQAEVEGIGETAQSEGANGARVRAPSAEEDGLPF